MRLSCVCPSCKKMHSEWTWMDFQTFIDAKSKLSRSEQAKYLLRPSVSLEEPSPTTKAEEME